MASNERGSKSNLNPSKTPRKSDDSRATSPSPDNRRNSSKDKDTGKGQSKTPRTKSSPQIPVPDESLWEKWDTPQLIAWLRSRKLNEEVYSPCWRIIEQFSLRGASLVTLNARTLIELKIKRAQAVVIVDEVKALKRRVPPKLYDDESEEEDVDGLDDPVSEKENSKSRSKSRGGAPPSTRDGSEDDKTSTGESLRGSHRSEQKSGDLKGTTPRKRKEEKQKQEEEEEEALEEAEAEEQTELERLMRSVFGDDDKEEADEESEEDEDGEAARERRRGSTVEAVSKETAKQAKSLFSCCFCASAEQPIKQENPSAKFLRRSKQRARRLGLNNKQFLELLTRKAKLQNPRATEADMVDQILLDRQTAQIRRRRQARKLTKLREAQHAAETVVPTVSAEMERRRRYQNNA